ncbi:MAG: exopolysaccharide biosynthesis protein [Rhizomicrobium sp.]
MSAIGHPPVPTLERVRIALPENGATIGWLHEQLETEAAYLLLFILALLGILPGLCIPAGVVLCLLAGEMMLLGAGHALPSAIASRHIGPGMARSVLDRAIAVLRFCETRMPLAGHGLPAAARFSSALLIFVLGAAMLLPVPLTNILPALIAAGLALALIEDSLVLCLIASGAALGLFGLMGCAVVLLV